MFPPLPDINGFLQSLKSRQIAAVAFFGFSYLSYPESFYETELIHRVAQEMPVVLISKEHSLLKLDCVYCDPGPQLQTYLEECYANGLRRFEYVGAGEQLAHLERRQRIFEDFLLARGLVWQRPIPADTANNETLVKLALDAKPEVVVASTAARLNCSSRPSVPITSTGSGIASKVPAVRASMPKGRRRVFCTSAR